MKAFVFFSVHEPMFDGIVRRLFTRRVLGSAGGFVWGLQQAEVVERAGRLYEPLIIFSRDVLPLAEGAPDIGYLQSCERRYGFSLNRVLLSERHLLDGRTFEQRLRLLEVLLRTLERAFSDARTRPDVLLTEDVSCMTSYLHWLVARAHRIPLVSVGQGKLTETVALFGNPMQRWDETEAAFEEILQRGLTVREREDAAAYVRRFRELAARPPSASVFGRVPGIDQAEFARLVDLMVRRRRDPGNPTLRPPLRAVRSRVARWARIAATRGREFAAPVDGERYALFPLQVEPEASTLVRGFMYVDQTALIADVARALPVGVRLYVKEHYASRGRRRLSFYRSISRIHGVRLLGPDADTRSLVRGADAVVTISSTMGWEALLWQRPVITFGEVFYNACPGVRSARSLPKDAWWDLMTEVMEAPAPAWETVLAFVAAVQRTLRPGFKANPYTFPRVLEPRNLDLLAEAVAARLDRIRSSHDAALHNDGGPAQ